MVEFPSGARAGEAPERVEVAPDVYAHVISLEDLVLDRVRQATDRTRVTYEEAAALITATYHRADWGAVENRLARATTCARR